MSALLASSNCNSQGDNDSVEQRRHALTRTLNAIAKSNIQTPAIQRSVYTSLTDTFKRLQQPSKPTNSTNADPLLNDSNIAGNLKTLLQLNSGDKGDSGSEALRLLRVEAIVAIAGAVSREAFDEVLKEGVRQLREHERSGVVRARLDGVLAA